MEQILIGSSLPYAAKRGTRTSTSSPVDPAYPAAAATPEELADGAIGVFTPTGALIVGITAAAVANTSPAYTKNLATTLADLKSFFIAVGGATIKRTPLLTRSVIQYEGAEYEGAVAQVSTVTPVAAIFPQVDGSLATTATLYNVGMDASIHLQDTTDGTISGEKKTYSVTVTAGMTLATLIDALVARINGGTSMPYDNTTYGMLQVTATDGNTYIGLTGSVAGRSFSIAADGVLAGSTIATTTKATPGVGTQKQIRYKEALSQAAHNGVMNQIGGRGEIPYTSLASAAGYDQYFLNTVKTNHSKTGAFNIDHEIHDTTVALPDGSAAELQLEAIFKALFNPEADTTTDDGVGQIETGVPTTLPSAG